MKILSAEQTRALDAYTIAHEPIASLDLMERAAQTFTEWFIRQFANIDRPVVIFCGPGNNGGDGLAIARLLHRRFYNVEVYACQIGTTTTEDFRVNLERLPEVELHKITAGATLPEWPAEAIVVDALFGSGLNRPIEGYWAKLIDYININASLIISVDIPSGVFADQLTMGPTIKAHHTLSFEMPKYAFLFPENQDAVGQWTFKSIGLSAEFIAQTTCPYFYITPKMIGQRLKPRRKHDHKGVFGHALLIAGSKGKMGAAVLAAKACLRSGVGLVTVHIPECGYEILQTSTPEAMISLDKSGTHFTSPPPLASFGSIGIGCGLDPSQEVNAGLRQLLSQSGHPLVLDADALNLLAASPDLIGMLPKNSILTPHPGEFRRLCGETSNSFERTDLLRTKAQEWGVYIVLKGAYTAIACPDGTCYFNSTGNPGMATGGSGDALTGLITGLLAQGYAPLDAALLGVYIHGLAGDLAAQAMGYNAMIAGDIIEHLGDAFKAAYA